MLSMNVQTKLAEAEENLRIQDWRSVNEILNQIFCITAKQLDCPEHCRRRHCRNDGLCYSKHPVGSDCSAMAPHDFYDIMAQNMAVTLAFVDLTAGKPIELDKTGLLLLIAYAATMKDNSKPYRKTGPRRSAIARR
jgi:hypothetical protein